jgi:diguanylate cyclase (GGDEF)-like protein
MEHKAGQHQEKSAHRTLLDAEEGNELFRLIFEGSADAIFVLDREGTVRLLNSGAERLLGRPAKQVMGHKFGLPFRIDEPKEVTISRPGKDTGIAEIRSIEVELHGETFYITSLRDVTEMVRLREELRALALVDELVGLCNRRGFFVLAQQQLKLASRAKNWLFLLLVNLDNLKRVQDTFGQQASDRLLVDAAAILKDTFRKSDIIARVSEETFAILAIETQHDGATIMATRLRKNIEEYNAKVGPDRALLASMGIANYEPEHPCSLDELMGNADLLLYGQKRGRQKSALLWYTEKSISAEKQPKTE